jgi:isoleucyl-tRNA synthetase
MPGLPPCAWQPAKGKSVFSSLQICYIVSAFPEYKGLNLPNIAETVLQRWKQQDTFRQSIQLRQGAKPFVFFEGPPSANGMPGIHHVMARTIKDLFCRYKTLAGHQVIRKAGWDTHGLPIELGVEKELGITKEDIGTKITVEEYNQACRQAVMRYTGEWNRLTEMMGYWVDMDDPYVTYHNKYIESVWWLLKRIYDKNLLYKGYTIQPYSPKAGTGLSSHELNQPGCYKEVTDMTAIAQFRLLESDQKKELFGDDAVYMLAWTTTPWTLPSNTALAVGPAIEYLHVQTINQYSGDTINVVLAGERLGAFFKAESENGDFGSYAAGSKNPPYRVLGTFRGTELTGLQYEQLLPYAKPAENPEKAFRVIPGDFVTTDDGTGIVHIAPTFGSDDMKVARDAGVPPMLVADEFGKLVPLVDLQGRFRPEVSDPVFGLADEYVKEDYLTDGEKETELARQKEMLKGIISDTSKLKYLSVDERIALKLQHEGKLFKKEKYVHSYPHCWRTDKPVLYYPLDSWFIRVTAVRERMAELNRTINWKPESTGTGRFGNWLENANDWNLSRSRFWGIPLPIWRTEEGTEEQVFGSVEDLFRACEQSVAAGLMASNPLAAYTPGDLSDENYSLFDLHKNVVDHIVLQSPSGKPMRRESDLIDVWFDSGAMPYAQWHYPFGLSTQQLQDGRFPADFIAEGVDQTRGWFYTLHAIATICFDSVAYKNVVSNGLVLDKNGQKMSKRLGNAVDPFVTLPKYGADAVRWYMVVNAPPWDNLRFDEEGVVEVQRKFFGTLYNTYAFFALYANVDGWTKNEQRTAPQSALSHLDKWIASRLQTLITDVTAAYEEYEPTRAARAIQEFVNDHLSNWYVRLNRKRFWQPSAQGLSDDKTAAYETLYECLLVTAQLMAPIAPFFADWLYVNLTEGIRAEAVKNQTPLRFDSVHHTTLKQPESQRIDRSLEDSMDKAQRICSLVHAVRKDKRLKVRQPLQKLMIPVLNDAMEQELLSVKDIILTEVNIKELVLLRDTEGLFVKKIKPNFKTIGPRYGKQMKAIAAMVGSWQQPDIARLEQEGGWKGEMDGEMVELEMSDFDIAAQDIPGWEVAGEGGITVALDISLTEELRQEGLAREMVNRIQNLRKDSGLEVTDRIQLMVQKHDAIDQAIRSNLNYICAETLANALELVESVDAGTEVELDEGIITRVAIARLN